MGDRLAEKVAIVTGSTRGIGEGIARRFGAEGAKVVVTGRKRELGEKVAAGIREDGGEAFFVDAELSDEANVKALVEEAVKHCGALTTLVNNAALTALSLPDKPVSDLDNDTLGRALGTNVYGTVWACRYAIPHLKARAGGSIINISSGAAKRAVPGMAAYSLTKAATNALTRQMARELGPEGVRVNSVVSGLVECNPETTELLRDPDFSAYIERAICLPGLGMPEDIATACTFLASDEARYVTGAFLEVDGGISAG